jgi:hypothetical protein
MKARSHIFVEQDEEKNTEIKLKLISLDIFLEFELRKQYYST